MYAIECVATGISTPRIVWALPDHLCDAEECHLHVWSQLPLPQVCRRVQGVADDVVFTACVLIRSYQSYCIS